MEGMAMHAVILARVHGELLTPDRVVLEHRRKRLQIRDALTVAPQDLDPLERHQRLLEGDLQIGCRTGDRVTAANRYDEHRYVHVATEQARAHARSVASAI